MKIILKILLLPIIFILGLIISIMLFLLEKIRWLLNIVSSIFFLFALLAAYASHTEDMPYTATIVILIFSYITSPYGLPVILEKLIILVDSLKEILSDI